MVEAPKYPKRTVTAPTTAGEMSGGRVLSVARVAECLSRA